MSQGKVILAIVCGILAGLVFSTEAWHVFAVRNAPIVIGHILERTPITQYSIPRVDFTIEIEGSSQIVHARAQRHLLPKVPEVVRFRYSGDPGEEVFLFEHEENPYTVVGVCWLGAVFLAVFTRFPYVRQRLGWTTPGR